MKPTSHTDPPEGQESVTIEANTIADSPSNRIVGRYKLLQKIGEGGMGAVWMAEQLHPVQRRVAIKLIRSERPTKEIIARFELERQALAIMDHPNLAKVFDAGETENGQPYFVMELVQGIPITEYCNQHRLSPQERLTLFASVCNAIQHAHQKGIIHRDIKPSNVLIAQCDSRPVVKVIDFGLAKAVMAEQRLTDETLFTEYGRIVGTLRYMSPEQAELDSQDIDTRTDIYSLGVLLYELLTGSTPLCQDSIEQAAILRVLEKIREDEPPTPSTRVVGSGATMNEILAERSIDLANYNRMLKGDLDWVVMKALEKDRTRRYETAAGLADDVRRFLQNEPVQARSPSISYRLSKLARKYRAAFVAGIAIIICVLLTTTMATGLSVWALAERTRADDKAREATKAEQAKAVELNRMSLMLYANQLANAQKEGSEGRVRLASKILDETQTVIRNWEYDYLRTLFSQQHRTLDSDDVRSAVFSPDHRHIVAGTFDGVIKVLDSTKRDKVIRTFGRLGRGQGVHDVAFSPDGKRLATSHYDGSVTLWDADAFTEQLTIQRPRYSRVSFSPDGTNLASGFDGSAFKVWDVATGKEQLIFAGHTDWVSSVAFSPDGRWIVSASRDRTLKIWDSTNGHEIRTLQGHTDQVTDVAFSPDGSRIVSASGDQTLRIWDPTTGASLLTLYGHSGQVNTADFRSDGLQIASGSEDRTVKVWDATSGKEIATVKAHDSGIREVAFSPIGGKILSVASELKLLDIANSDGYTLTGNQSLVQFVTFSPDGKTILSGDSAGNTTEWDVRNGKVVNATSSEVGGKVFFSANGEWMVDQQYETLFQTWDLSTQQVVNEFRVAAANGSLRDVVIAIGLDGKRFAALDGRSIRVWEATSGKEICTIHGNFEDIGYVCFSPKSDELVGCDQKGTVTVWDLRSCAVVRTFTVSPSSASSFACSPTAPWLVCGGTRPMVGIWDLRTGEKTQEWSVPAPVSCVAFSRDGQQVVTGHGRHGIVVRDIVQGTDRITVGGMRKVDHEVSSVAFNSDATKILVGDRYGVVQEWDAISGKMVSSQNAHANNVDVVAFGEDGQSIFSANSGEGLAVRHPEYSRQPPFAIDGDRFAICPIGQTMVSATTLYPLTVASTSIRQPRKQFRQRPSDDVWLTVISNDGQYVAVSAASGLEIWDLVRGQMMSKTAGYVTGLALAPDATRVAFVNYGSEIHVLAVPSGQKVLQIGKLKGVQHVYYSEDGEKLVSSNEDFSIDVWDAMTGERLKTFTGHTAPMKCVVFSPDGTRMVSGGEDATIRIWDVQYGIEILTLRGHRSAITSLAFSRDGTKIASGSNDTTIRVWDASGTPRE